jgi:hypothetical protein
MKARDIEKGVLLPEGYRTNPTIRRPGDNITRPGSGLNPPGRVYNPRTGKLENGEYMYVVDKDGNVIIGNRQGTIDGREFDFPHPTLIGGPNPNVQAAGKVWFEKGQVVKIDNGSGHFQPGVSSLSKAKEAFEKLGPGAYDPSKVKFFDHAGNPVTP